MENADRIVKQGTWMVLWMSMTSLRFEYKERSPKRECDVILHYLPGPYPSKFLSGKYCGHGLKSPMSGLVLSLLSNFQQVIAETKNSFVGADIPVIKPRKLTAIKIRFESKKSWFFIYESKYQKYEIKYRDGVIKLNNPVIFRWELCNSFYLAPLQEMIVKILYQGSRSIALEQQIAKHKDEGWDDDVDEEKWEESECRITAYKEALTDFEKDHPTEFSSRFIDESDDNDTNEVTENDWEDTEIESWKKVTNKFFEEHPNNLSDVEEISELNYSKKNGEKL